MSKSIYEEALENIKDNYPLVHPTNYKLIKESYDTLEKLVEQAQKQEKLLGLYQKLYHDYDDLTMNEEIDIQKQIKELENDR